MIRVYVSEDFSYLGVNFFVVQEREDGTKLLFHPGDENTPDSWEPVPSPATTILHPSFRLDGESSRALLEALVQHYHGADDARALRKDYDAERARVDKFIDTMLAAVDAQSLGG